jgi:hypothetical protein
MDDEINHDSVRPERSALMGIVGEAPPDGERSESDAPDAGDAETLPRPDETVEVSASVDVVREPVAFDPEVEDRYWAETYNAHPYAYGLDYKAFQPACRYGWESFLEYRSRSFDEVEGELRAGWEQHRGASGPDWDRARAAARAAWNRMERASRKGKNHDSGEVRRPRS